MKSFVSWKGQTQKTIAMRSKVRRTPTQALRNLKKKKKPVNYRRAFATPPTYKPIGEPVLYKGWRLHMKKFSFIRDSMHAAASLNWAWSRAIAKWTLQAKLMNRLTTSPRRSDEHMFRHSSLRSLVRSFAASVVSCNVCARYVVIRWWVELRQEHVVNWGANWALRCRIERPQSDDPHSVNRSYTEVVKTDQAPEARVS